MGGPRDRMQAIAEQGQNGRLGASRAECVRWNTLGQARQATQCTAEQCGVCLQCPRPRVGENGFSDAGAGKHGWGRRVEGRRWVGATMRRKEAQVELRSSCQGTKTAIE